MSSQSFHEQSKFFVNVVDTTLSALFLFCIESCVFVQENSTSEIEKHEIPATAETTKATATAVEAAEETLKICVDMIEMIDNFNGSEDVTESAAAPADAVENVAASLAKVEISSESSPADRAFGTDITTTPTKTFENSITVTDMLSASKSFAMTPSGKIKCSYTGHEMPATTEAVGAYMSGKKYRKAKTMADFDIDEFHPWIVETHSAENPDKVWCTVTNRFVSRDAEIIRRHMEGKTFNKMLATVENFEKLRGVPTPKGKRTVFDSPKHTPRSNPYTYNVHWTMDEYADSWGQSNRICIHLNTAVRLLPC